MNTGLAPDELQEEQEVQELLLDLLDLLAFHVAPQPRSEMSDTSRPDLQLYFAAPWRPEAEVCVYNICV